MLNSLTRGDGGFDTGRIHFYLLTDIHAATTATLTVTYNGLTVLTRNLFLSGFAQSTTG